jgi:hypothetical protein
MPGSNCHHGSTDHGTCDKGTSTTATPMVNVDIHSFVRATTTSSMDSSSPSPSGLGFADAKKIGRIQANLFYLQAKSNGEKA